MTNSVVLSFHDSLLRSSDYELLDEGRWLNDNVIAFAFEYFEKELFAKFANSVAFLSPDVGQFIKLANKDEDVGVFLEPLSLKSKDYVFVPVNNNSNPASSGGSHWSLLVYDRPLDHFEHFDSSDDMNRPSAEQLAVKLQPYLNASSGLVHSHETPRQQNANDCGVYVIAITEHLCHQLLTSYRPYGHGKRRDSEETDSLAYSLTPERITQTRHELRELINTLAAASAKH